MIWRDFSLYYGAFPDLHRCKALISLVPFNLPFHCFQGQGHCYVTISIVFPANHKQSFKWVQIARSIHVSSSCANLLEQKKVLSKTFNSHRNSFVHQHGGRSLIWTPILRTRRPVKTLCSRIGPSDSFPRNYLLSQARKNSSSRLPTSRAQNSRRPLKKTQFTIFTETIMHLVPPPPHQICVTIVFNFCLDGFNTQEKLETMVM